MEDMSALESNKSVSEFLHADHTLRDVIGNDLEWSDIRIRNFGELSRL